MNEPDLSSMVKTKPDAEQAEKSAIDGAVGSPDVGDNIVIVGLDGRSHDRDALALARSLQSVLGGSLVLAHVVPPGPAGPGMAEYEAIVWREGRELLARMSADAGEDVETQLVGPCPAARGLSWVAAEWNAGTLVLGSTHRGAIGRIVPGGVASQLLARAPCAIAVAPLGYAERAQHTISRIGAV
jgi:nucleotide-binding universal stress UspA family protein